MNNCVECRQCRHRQVQTETVRGREFATEESASVRDVRLIPVRVTVEVYENVERCRADSFKYNRHPFGVNGHGPVLTCREMRLNDCGKEGKLFEPLVVAVADASKPTMKRTHLGIPPKMRRAARGRD